MHRGLDTAAGPASCSWGERCLGLLRTRCMLQSCGTQETLPRLPRAYSALTDTFTQATTRHRQLPTCASVMQAASQHGSQGSTDAAMSCSLSMALNSGRLSLPSPSRSYSATVLLTICARHARVMRHACCLSTSTQALGAGVKRVQGRTTRSWSSEIARLTHFLSISNSSASVTKPSPLTLYILKTTARARRRAAHAPGNAAQAEQPRWC